jgi:putative ferrous iron transport protein C
MILNDVKNYVKTRQQVSLRDIAVHFDVEPEALKGMLNFLVSKGKISRQTSPACAGSCACSQSENMEIYSWNPQLGNVSIEVS